MLFRSGPIVTWTHRSNHTSRRAMDVYPDNNGPDINWSGVMSKRAIRFAKRLGWQWGGDWEEPDRPHLQKPKANGRGK